MSSERSGVSGAGVRTSVKSSNKRRQRRKSSEGNSPSITAVLVVAESLHGAWSTLITCDRWLIRFSDTKDSIGSGSDSTVLGKICKFCVRRSAMQVSRKRKEELGRKLVEQPKPLAHNQALVVQLKQPDAIAKLKQLTHGLPRDLQPKNLRKILAKYLNGEDTDLIAPEAVEELLDLYETLRR